mmetsp:Transcript_13428/g.33576  ORF Transcript_13428/g.33576 Transcript_13428/m.33576 type:complete len:201 (+) Transcript_13428:261-863(+)
MTVLTIGIRTIQIIRVILLEMSLLVRRQSEAARSSLGLKTTLQRRCETEQSRRPWRRNRRKRGRENMKTPWRANNSSRNAREKRRKGRGRSPRRRVCKTHHTSKCRRRHFLLLHHHHLLHHHLHHLLQPHHNRRRTMPWQGRRRTQRLVSSWRLDANRRRRHEQGHTPRRRELQHPHTHPHPPLLLRLLRLLLLHPHHLR